MSFLNPFRRRKVHEPMELSGDPAADMTRALLRIEAHLSELTSRTRNLDRLERRLQGIEQALRQI